MKLKWFPIDKDIVSYHCELNASCGGIPYLITAFRKAFLCRALNPSTYIKPENTRITQPWT